MYKRDRDCELSNNVKTNVEIERLCYYLFQTRFIKCIYITKYETEKYTAAKKSNGYN